MVLEVIHCGVQTEEMEVQSMPIQQDSPKQDSAAQTEEIMDTLRKDAEGIFRYQLKEMAQKYESMKEMAQKYEKMKEQVCMHALLFWVYWVCKRVNSTVVMKIMVFRIQIVLCALLTLAQRNRSLIRSWSGY